MWEGLQAGAEFEQEWMTVWLSDMRFIKSQLDLAFMDSKLTFPAHFDLDPNRSTPIENQKMWSILNSYVHMINNRLGILNQDEAYLGCIIAQSLDAIK